MFTAMVMAGVFGAILCIVIISGDWYQFTSLRDSASRYGCALARRRNSVTLSGSPNLHKHFTKHGLLELPHGLARFLRDQKLIIIRPYYHLFSMRFRTAWPLKGTIEVLSDGKDLTLELVKRTPWSSTVITIFWLGLVVIGTIMFVVMFALDGGFGSGSGTMLGIGILALGILVLIFGLILLSLAYRLEDQRIMQVYTELQDVLAGSKNGTTG